MVEFRNPISVSEAIALVQAEACRLGSEIVSLDEAYGRILAHPLTAAHDVPSFDRSPYDGYAIRAKDSAGASGDNRVSFQVVDHIGAGAVSGRKLGRGEAIRIMTGAQLPEGADAVVMLEQTQEAAAPAGVPVDVPADGESPFSLMGDSQQEGSSQGGLTQIGSTPAVPASFTIRKAFVSGENISFRGEDMREGEEILPAGSLILPGTIALLATFGHQQVEVSKLPLVGILATGTELLEPGAPLEAGKIRNSNGPMIAAQLRRMGVPHRVYAAAADRLDDMLDTVKQALAECDCLITTGGVSVGDFDLLPQVYEQLGANVLFNKVAMRPGSVTTVAVLDGRYLFGLSGNPSACYTGFELFARPALLRMMGAQRIYPLRTRAILGEDFGKANPFTRFIRAVYDGQTVRPAGFNKSNAVSSIGRSNALLVLPGGTRGFKTGDSVNVLLPGMEEGSAVWDL
ncbi:molybdopterin molybdotransferase MoeA [Saccharibacillus kuerlensis]|uniref:Molybdopterin molybdenumtransferase n=1 Tax=Saccharibacillus kuerlensis TaxID=459527 RepID=A0ABQ2L460_9BACL|nr:gephyrin-like molybdotransferase Glp [Saccharibacillus kuerlensis]GGO02040.1 molybdopterin molybdenumtransferase MoeA [Saccharibacillus kuerlensis]